LSASIGIILFNDDCPSGEVLLGQSSHAMSQAKDLGRHTVHFFDTNKKEDIAQKLTLDSEMQTALRESQFALFLQPQVDENGIIIGVEALMRWLHPEKGIVPPSGFIVPMSDWVLKCSCGYVNQLKELNLFTESGYIAVNLSAKIFSPGRFCRTGDSNTTRDGNKPSSY
jgi:predicted signal transduction protein with EAL and GGDEF domain